ncbi:bifunctional polysaccharide deacetylase/glycosyltransferase family 2 protein [Pseudarthrobacter sp. J75]|uniref:bifunctional polysaccharide deacetylase/glycosyltransferase family 2 protein n=1 Tax=unclassified Pseudarthrobacter TaxID=2647000 RepID=UPI002E81B183|nr:MULTISPECIES: bifunctional polysaccharide deacetylase/glycosyltransferase family 2 protein [unclassified Pseudarthrobacter]MEE2523005.1 bifunctional polysaccharide deacetylase/glycosyltransferase family 2 protein [Pseudarthrobacter sp. J47]MEE2529688.1 bifunctional polysaccharide deacetylase/glycosyltransferase family 2 protein [Pseudarthrobacter sp. J75]
MKAVRLKKRDSPAGVRAHWVIFLAVLMALGLALAVQGYVHQLAGIGNDSAPAGINADKVPADVVHGGPVIDARDGAVRTATPADKTIALTFDDGPDPEWTPRILEVLRKHHVHATFFVVGSAAIDHPDVLRQIVDEGHEVGVHTLTHVDLGSIPDWRRQLEVQGGQDAIVGVTGQAASLLRPPFSFDNSEVANGTWRAMQASAGEGFLSVLSTLDSADWERPGAAAIKDNIAASGPEGQIVLMHDGGGDREQTVTALDAALTQYAGQGYRVTSVGDAVGIRSMRDATMGEKVSGTALVWGVRLSDFVVTAISWALVAAGVVTLVRAVLVVAFAARHKRAARRLEAASRGRRRVNVPVRPPITEPVSVIVPAYNEAAGIEAAVRSLAASEHPVEIIVVDDGSTDGTADIAEGLGLPGVVVLRKENGGKPSALNAGLRVASHDLVVMVDGDTVFEPQTVRALIQPFADPAVGAVSGNTKVANRGGILGAWQHIEYVVGFNLDRRLFDIAECMPTVPGAIGAFRKEALLRIGGVSDDTLAEDTDLTMALCRDGWRVVYQDDALAWTEAPASLGSLWRQRYRWCYGTLQAMWKHRGAVVQRGPAGKLGRRGLGYLLVLQVLIPLFAPVVDVFAIYGLVFLDPLRIAALWLVFLLVQFLMAAYAFRLDKEPLGPLWTLPLQQFVYRQLMYLVVIQSVVTALAGVHLRWHRMERYGSLQVPPAAGAPTGTNAETKAGVSA